MDLTADGALYDLHGFSFTIAFDPTVVTPVAVTAGPLLDDAGCSHLLFWINPEPGHSTLEVDAGLLGCGVDGPGAFLQLEFIGVDDGLSGLSVTNGVLRDGQNQSIIAIYEDGSIEYICAFLSLDPSDGAFECEETITIEILVDEAVEDLVGFSLVLDFDPDFVVPLDARPGSLVTEAGCDNSFVWLNQEPGQTTVEIDCDLLGCSVDGPGSIFEVTFGGGLKSGTSDLALQPTGQLRDNENDPIAYISSPATVEYSCQIPAAAAMTWGALKGLYR